MCSYFAGTKLPLAFPPLLRDRTGELSDDYIVKLWFRH